MTDIDMDELKENLAQCRRCGICRNAVYEEMGFDGVCPVWRCSTGFETSFMRGRIQVAKALLDGQLEPTAENVESLYTCTLCGNCTQICAAEFDPAKTLLQVRQVLNSVPNDARDDVVRKILENLNPYEKENNIRRNWAAEVGFDIPFKGSILYYVGCTAGLRLPSIAISTSRILRAAGEEFAVLEEESCCGSVMLRTGATDSAKKMAEKLVESFKEAGAEKIIVSCAGCLNTLRNDFPQRFGLEVPEVIHVVEYAAELLSRGILNPKDTGESIIVTYHDPCHLGREQGIYDAPREILGSIPGVELVEMETVREAAMCCGAGGGVRSYDSNLAKRIAADRIGTALDTGARVIATACPFCVSNLVAGARQMEESVRIVDVVDLLAEHL